MINTLKFEMDTQGVPSELTRATVLLIISFELVVAFGLSFCYFEVAADSTHALQHSFKSALTWFLSHFTLALALLHVSAGLNIMLDEIRAVVVSGGNAFQLEFRKYGQRVFCIGVSCSLLLMVIIRGSHRGFSVLDKDGHLHYGRLLSYVLRVLVSLIPCILPIIDAINGQTVSLAGVMSANIITILLMLLPKVISLCKRSCGRREIYGSSSRNPFSSGFFSHDTDWDSASQSGNRRFVGRSSLCGSTRMGSSLKASSSLRHHGRLGLNFNDAGPNRPPAGSARWSQSAL